MEMHDKRMLDFESVFADIYGTGFYQILLLITCSATSFIGGIEIQSILFMHHKPQFTCQDVPHSPDTQVIWISKNVYNGLLQNQSASNLMELPQSERIEQCWAAIQDVNSKTITPFACSNWTFDETVMSETVVTQFELICDREFWYPLMESFYLLFTSVGFVLAFVTDVIGRRIPLLVFSAWGIIISVATPFVRTAPLLLFLRCCRGVSGALMYIGINLVAEMIPLSRRAAYGNVYWTSWPIGYMVCAGIAYLTRHWVYLRLYLCLFLLIYLCYPFIVFESPRWLYVRGRNKEALQILKKIAKWNRAKLPENYFENIQRQLDGGEKDLRPQDSKLPNGSVTEIFCNQTDIHLENKSEKPDSISDFFRVPILRNRTIIFCVAHVAIATVYYGLLMDSVFADDNIFVNVFLSGVMETPTSFLAWGVADYLGRRNSTAIPLFISGIAVLVTKFIAPYVPVLRTIAALTGKLCLSVAYCVADLYIAEIFPTTLRNVGFFAVVTIPGIVSAVAPYINRLTVIFEYLPCLIYSSLAFSGSFLIYFLLPETRGCPLPQTVKELEGFVRGKEKEWCQKRKHSLMGTTQSCDKTAESMDG